MRAAGRGHDSVTVGLDVVCRGRRIAESQQVNNEPRIVIDGRYLGARASGIGEYVRALVTRVPRLAPDLPFRLWVRERMHVPPEIEGTIQIHRANAQPNGLVTLVRPTLLDRLTPHDIFHAPYNILGFGLPCRSIVTVHDVMWLTAPGGCEQRAWRRPFGRLYYMRGIRHALRRATTVLTVSEASACQIANVEPLTKGKIVVTPNACEERYRPAVDRGLAEQRVSRMLGIKGRYILLVGQNQPSKGHELALRAFAKVRSLGLDLVLIQRLRVADGLIALAGKLGVRRHLRFVDEVPRADLVALMQSATALLQPSSDEGFGLPVLEAAACGCPVVASDLPVFREVLGDAARYVPAHDVSAWSKAILEVATDGNLARELRLRGPLRAAQFSWDRTAERTFQVYRDALGRA